MNSPYHFYWDLSVMDSLRHFNAITEKYSHTYVECWVVSM